MKVIAHGDKIIVKRDEAETQTKAGILLPEGSAETPITAVVVSVGDAYSGPLAEGDRVVLNKWAGIDIPLPTGTLTAASPTDIAMILRDD